MLAAGYQADKERFLLDTPTTIIGALATNSSFALEMPQRDAWLAEISHLQSIVAQLENCYVLLEFTIPRMGRRVDAVLLTGGCIFVLEYKVGARHFSPADIDQVVGYGLDLKNFHEPSHSLPIFPILIATDVPSTCIEIELAQDQLARPICVNNGSLAEAIAQAVSRFGAKPIEPQSWARGRYKPTPTIVEAAQTLYRTHRVDDITRNEAGAENLSTTSDYVSAVIESSKRTGTKSICFITGVPGSGKTLAGLNIASARTRLAQDEYAVFLPVTDRWYGS